MTKLEWLTWVVIKEISGDFPVICKMELFSEDLSGGFPVKHRKISFFDLFEPIGGISPSIEAILKHIY